MSAVGSVLTGRRRLWPGRSVWDGLGVTTATALIVLGSLGESYPTNPADQLPPDGTPAPWPAYLLVAACGNRAGVAAPLAGRGLGVHGRDGVGVLDAGVRLWCRADRADDRAVHRGQPGPDPTRDCARHGQHRGPDGGGRAARAVPAAGRPGHRGAVRDVGRGGDGDGDREPAERTSPRSRTGPSGPNGPGKRRRAAGSTPNGCVSLGSCTMWSRTRWPPSMCRRPRRRTYW